jgi:sensor histidine kinase regulating citrate/malate metabolism
MSADDMESVMKTGVSDARPARGYAMMGFAFARRVAEAQGGSLTAESVDDGRIRLKFQFPRTAA